ncbi:MAG: type III pantothenate kinase [Woeseiaceae bacterium]
MSEVRALLFDVGNTRLKWGLLENGRIGRTGSILHARIHDSGFASFTTRLPRRVDRVFASNVAGASFATRLSGVIGIHCGCDIHFAHCEKEAYGVTNSYKQARRMGVDRWVAMIGARSEFRGAVCIVDAGTAVTIDAIDKDGVHLGGQIIPGLALMGNALSSDTSDIPASRQAPRDPGQGMAMFAKNTAGGVHSGALNAVCGAIERAVRVLRAGGHRPKIVLTGGDASRILKQLGDKVLHRPNLVLQGLAFMVQSES